jgi:hypothetical protein
MRFLNLLDTDRQDIALQVAHYFLELSLNNELIGCFKIISTKLDVPPDLVRFQALRNTLRKETPYRRNPPELY